MKNIIKISLVAFVLLACASCGLFRTNYTFVNASGYTIYIQPNGQVWLPFYVGPGQQYVMVLEAAYSTVQFLYSPSDKVYPVDGNNMTTFYNR